MEAGKVVVGDGLGAGGGDFLVEALGVAEEGLVDLGGEDGGDEVVDLGLLA